jgi:TPR repeat protein
MLNFFKDNDDNYEIGFDYMMEAAEKGDRNSLYFIGKAFDTGLGLSKNK